MPTIGDYVKKDPQELKGKDFVSPHCPDFETSIISVEVKDGKVYITANDTDWDEPFGHVSGSRAYCLDDRPGMLDYEEVKPRGTVRELIIDGEIINPFDNAFR